MHMLYMPRPLYSGMRFNSVGGLARLCSGDERKLAARMGAGSSSRVASLRKAIRENDPSVIEVSLDRLQLSDKTVRKLSDALRQNSVVQQLSMQGCGVTAVGLQHVSDTLCNDVLTCNIRKLNLSGNELIGVSGAHSVASVLESNKVLEQLVLNDCDLGDKGIEPIANALCRNRTLVTLELGTNVLTDTGAQLLGDALKLNFKLEGLSLWQNEISGRGAQCIAEGLQVNKSLLWLGLGSNQVGAEGVWALVESLRTNSSLLWLGLGGNELGDRGALHLATLLQGNMCSLQSLGLGGNEIHDEGVIHLVQALKTNTRLRSLGLGGNQIADEGGKEIAEMLRHNQTIRKLLLSSNLLGDGAVEHLADALQVNSGLEMLLLADNPFGDEGGQQLAEVLCNGNRSLRVLDIHGTRMTRAAEREVVQELQQFSALTKLGSAYAAKSSQRVTEVEGLARKQARQLEEQRFQQQASSFTATHLY